MSEPRVRKPTPTIFDFQNIPYIYAGKTPSLGLDCFTLYNFVRYKFDKEIVNGFMEYYKYELHKDMPKGFLQEISIETFGQPNGDVKETHLPFLLNNWDGEYGFGTIVYYLDKPYMVTTSIKRGSAVFPLSRYQGKVSMVWDLKTCEKNRIEKVDNFYGLDIC